MTFLGNEIDTATLARMMPDSWPVFFRRRRPWPAQVLAMPHIVRGESVLLATPTASGKTEAAVAPLFQRHVSFQRDRLSVVYVAPTKALVNDLHVRLDDYLGIRFPHAVQRYTGDRHEFRSPQDAFCLIATPEALDSLQLTRPRELAGVRAIIVDEIHLLHGSARGQQLRYVIDRIRHASSPPKSAHDNFQVIGMTATIDQVDKVRSLWLGENSTAVSHGAPRDIELDFVDVPASTPGDLARERATALRHWLDKSGATKVLVFANSRNAAHALAAALSSALSETHWPVHLHIGVLAPAERERVEEAMRTERFGVCVATSTLEIGIDIGDIDAIVLSDPPKSVSSFLQRIGRGNRRSGICRVVAFRDSVDTESVFGALLDCARRGELDDVHEYDRPSVRFQQVLSLTWHAVRHEDGLKREEIPSLSGGVDHADVVDDMLDMGAISSVHGVLIPSDEWIDTGDERRIHTVISGGSGLPVIDTLSGNVVASAARHGHTGGLMYIGGKFKQLHGGADGSMYLEPPKEGRHPLAKLPTTHYSGGLSRVVVWAIACRNGLDPTWWHWEGSSIVTWGGTTYNRLLAALFEYAQVGARCTSNDLSIDGIDQSNAINFVQVREWAETAQAQKLLPRTTAKHFLESTRFLSALSPGLQAEEAQNAIPFAGFLKWIGQCKGIRT